MADRWLGGAAAVWGLYLLAKTALFVFTLKPESAERWNPATNPILWIIPLLWLGFAIQVLRGTGKSMVGVTLTGMAFAGCGFFDSDFLFGVLGLALIAYGFGRLSGYLGPRPPG